MGMNDRAADKKADKTAARKSSKAKFEAWRGFVDVEMTAEDKVACKAATVDFDQVWADLEELVEEGYKMTLSYDEAHTTWNVSLTCRAEKHVNEGYTMSARGGSFAAAARAFWFKHFSMLNEDWSAQAKKGSSQLAADDFG